MCNLPSSVSPLGDIVATFATHMLDAEQHARSSPGPTAAAMFPTDSPIVMCRPYQGVKVHLPCLHPDTPADAGLPRQAEASASALLHRLAMTGKFPCQRNGIGAVSGILRAAATIHEELRQ